MRIRLAPLFAALCLAAGCSGGTSTLAQAGRLSCSESVADACARTGGCALTWNDADLVAAFCPDPSLQGPLLFECGGFHIVMTMPSLDVIHDYVYDAASGMLVAITTSTYSMTADPMAAITSVCDAGPAAGFTLPNCPGAASQRLSQCGAGTAAN